MNINVEFEVILQSSNVDFLETIIVKKSSTTYTMGRIPRGWWHLLFEQLSFFLKTATYPLHPYATFDLIVNRKKDG